MSYIHGAVDTLIFDHCCVPTVRDGPGNIWIDPKFCGWQGPPEVFVDAASQGGDGTRERPFADLSSALSPTGYFALAADSPCRGASSDGGDMGASLGTCASAGVETRQIRLAPGRYMPSGSAKFDLGARVSLYGSGVTSTFVEGTISGLRTGAVVQDLTVTRGVQGGMIVSWPEEPSVIRCAIVGNDGFGLIVNSASPLIANCLIAGNKLGGVSSGSINSAIGSALVQATTIVDNGTTQLRLDWGGPQLRLQASIVWSRSSASSPLFDPPSGFSQSVLTDSVLGSLGSNFDPYFVLPGIYDFTRYDTSGPIPRPDFVVRPGDYQLFRGSPAQNATSATWPGLLPEEARGFDLAGNQRSVCGSMDQGAYEVQACGATDLVDVSPLSGQAPLSIVFDASQIIVREGGPLTFEWFFGDEIEGGGPEPGGPVLTHVYQEPGIYVARLLVTRANGVSFAEPVARIPVHGAIAPWTASDFGTATQPGITRREEDCISVTVFNTGPYPQGHLVHQSFSGDFEVVARIASFPTSTRRQVAGILIPELNFGAGVFNGGPINTRLLRMDGSSSYQQLSPALPSLPWLRVSRSGGTFTSSYSLDGAAWTDVSTLEGTASAVIAGLYVSHSTAKEASSVAFCDVSAGPLETATPFRRGEANADGQLDLSDAVAILSHLFTGGAAPTCEKAADANGDGRLDISDAVTVLSYLFLGGDPLPAPGPEACGSEPAESASPLGCDFYAPCQ